MGDKVTFHIFRDGEKIELPVTLGRKDPKDYISDPYIIDTPPKFYVLGGLILQELSRQLLSVKELQAKIVAAELGAPPGAVGDVGHRLRGARAATTARRRASRCRGP